MQFRFFSEIRAKKKRYQTTRWFHVEDFCEIELPQIEAVSVLEKGSNLKIFEKLKSHGFYDILCDGKDFYSSVRQGDMLNQIIPNFHEFPNRIKNKDSVFISQKEFNENDFTHIYQDNRQENIDHINKFFTENKYVYSGKQLCVKVGLPVFCINREIHLYSHNCLSEKKENFKITPKEWINSRNGINIFYKGYEYNKQKTEDNMEPFLTFMSHIHHSGYYFNFSHFKKYEKLFKKEYFELLSQEQPEFEILEFITDLYNEQQFFFDEVRKKKYEFVVENLKNTNPLIIENIKNNFGFLHKINLSSFDREKYLEFKNSQKENPSGLIL